MFWGLFGKLKLMVSTGLEITYVSGSSQSFSSYGYYQLKEYFFLNGKFQRHNHIYGTQEWFIQTPNIQGAAFAIATALVIVFFITAHPHDTHLFSWQ